MGAAIADGPDRLLSALNAIPRRRSHDGEPHQSTLKLLLVADSDSQLACEALCSAPTVLHVHWTINVIPRDGTPGRCWSVSPSGPPCTVRAWPGCCAIAVCRA